MLSYRGSTEGWQGTAIIPLKLFPKLRATVSKGTAYSPSGPRGGRGVGTGAVGEGGGSESWGRE